MKPKLNIRCDVQYIDYNNLTWTGLRYHMLHYTLIEYSLALNTLYASIITTIINPELYPAALVGYSTEVTSTSRGISLSISGFSDSTVVSKIIDIVTNGKSYKQTTCNDSFLFSND